MTKNEKNLTPKMPKFAGGAKVVEKPKDFKKSWVKLIKVCKPFFIPIIISILLAVVGSVLTLIGPNKISEMTNLIIDGILTGVNLTKINSLGFTLIIIFGLAVIFSYAQGFIMSTVTQKITKNMRNSISKKINKLPLKYLDSKSYGDVLSRVTNDVDTIGQTLNNSIVQLFSSLALFLGSVAMMFYTNWIMALCAICATILGFIAMIFIITKSQKYFKKQQDSLGAINGHIEEIYAGHNVVKAYNGEKIAKKRFDEINEKLYNSAWKSQFYSGLALPIMNFIGNFSFVVVCVVGADLALKGIITFGVIIAFMIYVRLFTQALSQLSQVTSNLQSTAAASERVFEFLDETELADESNKTKTLTNVKGNVEFKDVRFGYNPKKIIIKDFSANVKAGQKVAIVGPTGAGKTTMVNLIMKFYEPNSGEIFIDEIPTSELKRDNVHSLFGMVLQDTWIFEGTIKENIRYSKNDVTDEQIISACKSVGLDHFIKTLPKGYDTVLNENSTISAGQRQLLTIARAMVQNSPMLILDEATSSVDTRTEILIQKAMDKLTKGRTSFVIAHRLSTIKNADLILVMKDGDIIESGNHNELLKQNGFYAELYNSQFSEE